MYPLFIVPFAALFFSILSHYVSRERWDKWAFLTRPSNPLKTVKNFVKTCVHTVIWVLEEKIIEFFTSYILNCTNYIQNVHVMSSNMNQKLWCWMWITKNLWKFFYDISNNQNQITYKKYFCRELYQNHTPLLKKKIKHTYLKVISVTN